MKISFLYSSSSGNCTAIESDDGTTTILIDVGVSFKKVKTAMDKEDLQVDAVFITHEHSDHIQGAGILGRKLKCPIYLHEDSYAAAESIFADCEINTILAGDTIKVGVFEITSFSLRHDSKASLGYSILDTTVNKRFGFVTDTGHITKLTRMKLIECDALFIESDYDENMLEKFAEYDDFLKERIKSPFGHLSNQHVSSFIKDSIDLNKVQFIALGHLSKSTNSPETLTTVLKETIGDIEKIHIIDQIKSFTIN